MSHFSWETIWFALFTGIPFIAIVVAFWFRLRAMRHRQESCCHKANLESAIVKAKIAGARVKPKIPVRNGQC